MATTKTLDEGGKGGEVEVAKQLLRELETQRAILELEADAIHSELTSPTTSGGPAIGLDGPLIDGEGFPRGDVDIYRVKNIRQRFRVINTDHKALMKQIEQVLQTIFLHNSINQTTTQETTSATATPSSPSLSAVLKPFARIDQVLSNSPASLAGIRDNDLLVAFGSISTEQSSSHQQLFAAIPAELSKYVNQELSLQVQREGNLLLLTLIPKTWEGRGLLGCHLMPLT